MRCTQNWMLKTINALIIVTNCWALKQEIGEECTNKNGIVGFCQIKNKCLKDTDLGSVCNLEQNVICCAKDILKNKHLNSTKNQKEEKSIQSRFGLFPDFFHSPISSQIPIADNNFFNYQNQKIPDFVSNTMAFVEERPYQNFEKKIVTTNIYSPNNNQNLNIEAIFDNDQTTKRTQNYYNYPTYETQRPNQNQNINNNYPNFQSSYNHNNQAHYEMHPLNQNYNINNNYYPSSVSPNIYSNQYINNNHPNQNNYPSSHRPNRNQNNHNNRPDQTNQNQNNNINRPYQPNQNQNNNIHRPYQPNQNQNSNIDRPYQPNQNNNFNENSYYTSTQKPQNYLNTENTNNSVHSNSQPNYNGYQENKRPSTNINHRPTSSNIFYPDYSTESYTKFTTTTNYYDYQNRPNGKAKRISEIKCEDYSKTLTTTISALPLSIDTATKSLSIEKCNSKSVGLIVGGTKAELGEFPHMVALGFQAVSEISWNCGGTLISERFVLTAAHCIQSSLGNPVKIRLGDLNLQKNNDGANPIDFLVDKIIVHPDYVSTSKYNDIALIRLDKTVKFNNHIRPACLYNNDNIYSRKVTATGWGSIGYGEQSSDDLLKVDLDVINNQRCNKLYEAESKTTTLNRGIIDSMMCAGNLAGGYDTCLGDSGGPLAIRSEKNACIFNLIGITSFGKFCATENSPGVYTKVSTFLPWIEQIVWS